MGANVSVVDALQQLKNHFRSLGGWSFAFNPYYRENLTMELDNPNTQRLWDLVDPYSKSNDKTPLPHVIVFKG